MCRPSLGPSARPTRARGDRTLHLALCPCNALKWTVMSRTTCDQAVSVVGLCVWGVCSRGSSCGSASPGVSLEMGRRGGPASHGQQRPLPLVARPSGRRVARAGAPARARRTCRLAPRTCGRAPRTWQRPLAFDASGARMARARGVGQPSSLRAWAWAAARAPHEQAAVRGRSSTGPPLLMQQVHPPSVRTSGPRCQCRPLGRLQSLGSLVEIQGPVEPASLGLSFGVGRPRLGFRRQTVLFVGASETSGFGRHEGLCCLTACQAGVAFRLITSRTSWDRDARCSPVSTGRPSEHGRSLHA